MRGSKGFTLIELMNVVAIIPITAAVTLPAYQEYVPCTRAIVGLWLAGRAKTRLATHYLTRSNLPHGNNPCRIISRERVTSITAGGSDGIIQVRIATAARLKMH